MKVIRKIGYRVLHQPTGASIPMMVSKNSKNEIEEYKELTNGRKGFTLEMLKERWKMSHDEVIELLQKYKVPAHVNHKEVTALPPGSLPVEVATFFEEYILALEQKINLDHKKIKSRHYKDSE